MSIILGTSQIEITPPLPIPLAGFAHRVGTAKEMHSSLYLKTYFFERDEQVMILLIGDVIWWDGKLVEQWKKKIETEFGIPGTCICFHSTHNHSGPQTSKEFTHFLGLVDEGYMESLEGKILTSIDEASRNKEVVTAKKFHTNCELNVNRRKIEGTRVVMKPNREGSCDSYLTVITFENDIRDVKAMLIHYTCHPTTTDANVVSSEFPGQCCTVLKEQYKGTVIGFLQGCCGDVRPAFIRNDEFYRGSIQDMEKMGKELATHVLRALENGGSELSLQGEFHSEVRKIPLVFKRGYACNTEFERLPDVQKAWQLHQEKVWRDVEFVELEVQILQVGHDLLFLGFNGEMVQEYGLEVKRMNWNALPMGYSNGMIGYVPTSIQLREGGYEAEDFIYYFGLPAPFQPIIEEVIKKEIKNMMDGEGIEH